MKTMGLLGGMSWESSAVYYRILNREMQKRLGGVHSAKLLMYSFDFAEIATLQAAGEWEEATERMRYVGRTLVDGGADFLLICCNTMHLMSDEVEEEAGIPLLHIADPLGRAIRAKDIRKVGLLGSRFTMDDGRVIKDRLKRFGVETITPAGEDHAEVDRVIYEELIRGKFLENSRAACRNTIARLVQQGAEGIILGCTELPLLVKAEDSEVPLFDTTELHALAAVDMALS